MVSSLLGLWHLLANNDKWGAQVKKHVDKILASMETVLKALLHDDAISRTESQVPGTDWRVVGYRLTRNTNVIRFDIKEFIIKESAPPEK